MTLSKINPTMPIYGDEIAEYKEFFIKCSQYKTTSHQAITQLKNMLDKYQYYHNKSDTIYFDAVLIATPEVDDFLKKSLLEFKSILSNSLLINEFEKVNYNSILEKLKDTWLIKNAISPHQNEILNSLSKIALNNLMKSAVVLPPDRANREVIAHRLNLLKRISICIDNQGLHPKINNRNKQLARYNILVRRKTSSGFKKECVILLKEGDLIKNYTQPYNLRKTIIVNGKRIKHEEITRIKISIAMYNDDESISYARVHGFTLNKNDQSTCIKYFNICKDITADFINTSSSNLDFESSISYISESRINELNELRENGKFDLSKLLAYCEALNGCYQARYYIAIPILVRAIIDHIPPIFDREKFESAYSHYGSKSFKEQMKHLDKSLRNMADGYLHNHIRIKETLPNNTQVNFSQALDVLLGEICVLLRK